MRTPAIILLLFSAIASLRGQIVNLENGGYYQPANQCLSPEQRQEIKAYLHRNISRLRERRELPPANRQAFVSFGWPLRQAAGYNDPGYYGISNFVDHDPSNSDSHNNWVEDYNCGMRSYDVAGYNHAGVDIFLWPFSWTKVNNNAVEIIAAAAGIIIGKIDGNPHTNCSFNSDQWNAVYLQHSDGSVTWYGHMKNGSLTPKNIGAFVAKGEYLGVVGSSGNSTGPHLHFEVYDPSDNLIDPYAGPCNSLNSNSWWDSQKPYYESRVNKLMTHFAAPVFNDCPAPATINESNQFDPGDVVYFATYYQDQRAGQVSQYRIRRPDGSIFDSWTHSTSVSHYAASWWWWSRAIPASGPQGAWAFEVTFQGQTYTHTFQVGGANCPAPTLSQIAATNITSTAARLTCSITGVEAYDWAYMQVGSSTWVNLPGTTSNFTDITGLLPGATYEFSVSVRCGPSLWSDWSDTETFTTSSPGVVNDLCSNAVSISCGQSVSGSTSNATTTGAPTDCGTTLSTSPGVWYSFTGNGQNITATTCSPGSGFDTKIGIFTGSCNNLSCVAGDDDDDNCNVSGLLTSVTFSSVPGQQYYIYVTGYESETGAFHLSLDCAAPQPCDPPDGFGQSDAGYAYVAVEWDPVPGADAYQTRIRAQGSTNWNDGSWSPATTTQWVNATPCAVYELQVRADCGGSLSDYSNIITAATEGCGDIYCYSYGLSWDQWIERVALANLSNASGDGNGYTNFTNLTADIERGQSYSLTLDPDTDVASTTVYWRAWIDFNGDGDFGDSGEQVASATGNSQSAINTSISIPATAATGLARMRVSMSADGYLEACDTQGNQDVEDYSVNISAPPPVLNASPLSVTFPAAASSEAISITANVGWSATENVSWLSLANAGGNGNGFFTVNCLENTGASSRTATVTVSGGGLTRTISVTQQGADAYLEVTPLSVSFSAAASSETATVTANVGWSATESASWLSLANADGAGNGSFTINCLENTGTAPRTATVTVSGGGVTQNITVTQLGTAPSLGITPTSVSFPAAPASENIAVTANVGWSATESVSWLSLANASGSGNGSFTINCLENTGTAPRTATVAVSGSGITQNITVTQEGADDPGTGTPSWGEPIPTIASGVLIGQVQVGGQPASPGDWVAAFDEAGNLAGAREVIINQGLAYINLTIYGDDANTPVDEGINAGEAFTLHLYDASEDRVLDYPYTGAPQLFTQWMNTNGAPMPAYSNPGDIYNFEDATVDVIPLEPGWNLVSTDVVPADSSVAALMAGLLPGNLEYVTGFEGAANFYDPGLPAVFNTLTHWKRGFGYWIRVIETDTLRIPGQLIGPDYFKPMDEGWNLIAYLPQTPQAPGAYLSGFINSGQLQYVTGFDGQYRFYDPNGLPFLNSLQELRNSKGYWMKLQGAATLEPRQGGHIPNPVYEFIWGHANASEGDWINVVDETGKVWASLPVAKNGAFFPAPLYGDNPLTPADEGPPAGARLLFEWKGLIARENVAFQGGLRVRELDLTFEAPAEKMLHTYPSPFRDVLNIRFQISEPGYMQTRITDAYGREVWDYTSSRLFPGWHQLEWKAEEAQGGIYLVSLYQNGRRIASSRALLIR